MTRLRLDPATIERILLNGIDSDGDGLPDEIELLIGTNPFDPDTDHDGYPDGLEVELGSNPLDPNSVPVIGYPGETYSPIFSIQNLAIFIANRDSKTDSKGDSHVASNTSPQTIKILVEVAHRMFALRDPNRGLRSSARPRSAVQ
jgi:hypothetical protein